VKPANATHVFRALADPVRRDLLDRLLERTATHPAARWLDARAVFAAAPHAGR